jgi:hypothetical protein
MFSCQQCLKTYPQHYLSSKYVEKPTCIMCAKHQVNKKPPPVKKASNSAKIVASEGQVYFGPANGPYEPVGFTSVSGLTWDHPDADPVADLKAAKEYYLKANHIQSGDVVISSGGSFNISGAATYNISVITGTATHLSPTGKRSHEGAAGDCMITSCVAARGKSKSKS